jgi:hypothetical protein
MSAKQPDSVNFNSDGTLIHARHMRLRDYFAAKTLPCIIDHCTTNLQAVEEAYKIADAMLEARKS